MPRQHQPGTTPPTTPATAPDPPCAEWTAHPARQRPLAAAAAIVVIVALAALVADLGGHPAWGVFAAVVLCLSLHRFFFASSYRIDAAGVHARTLTGTRSLPWDQIRRVELGTRGAWCSSFARRHVMEFRRGVLLLFGPDPQAAVAALRHYAGDRLVPPRGAAKGSLRR